MKKPEDGERSVSGVGSIEFVFDFVFDFVSTLSNENPSMPTLAALAAERSIVLSAASIAADDAEMLRIA